MNTFLLTALLLATPAGETSAGIGAAGAPGSAATAASAVPAADLLGERVTDRSVIGTVSDGSSPLPATGVYAYRLADLSLRKVLTDAAGSFSFGSLPSGVYKIIAHKPGFLPAMIVLTRANAAIFQQVDFDLTPEEEFDVSETSSFWSIRERIPTDVLREITIANGAHDAATADRFSDVTRFSAEVQAVSGAGAFATAQSSSMTGGDASLEAQFGEFEVAIEGSFRALDSDTGAAHNRSIGSANGIALRLDAGDADPLNSRVSLTGHQAELGLSPVAAQQVDYERYGLTWAADLGGGTSQLRADFTEEANFYRDPRLRQFEIPMASSTLQLQGEYDRDLGARSSLRTGLRYSSRSSREPTPSAWGEEHQRFELFGVAGLEFADTVVIEYGLFTTMNEGEVAFSPHGGVIVDLGDVWKASATMRKRIRQETDWRVGFAPLYFGSAQECSSAEDSCYRVKFTRSAANELEVAGTLREYSDVARLYFSEDFFDQFDSVLFVPGDRLPELRFSVRQRLSPNISTRFQSSLASGGGGVLEGAEPRRNRVEYVVTSLDTQFETSQTGLLLAFHSLQQSLEQVEGVRGSGASTSPESYDMDRLQLLITQGLGRLLGFGVNWDVLLDMQVSRGADPFQVADVDELRRRVVGGLAVRF